MTKYPPETINRILDTEAEAAKDNEGSYFKPYGSTFNNMGPMMWYVVDGEFDIDVFVRKSEK